MMRVMRVMIMTAWWWLPVHSHHQPDHSHTTHSSSVQLIKGIIINCSSSIVDSWCCLLHKYPSYFCGTVDNLFTFWANSFFSVVHNNCKPNCNWSFCPPPLFLFLFHFLRQISFIGNENVKVDWLLLTDWRLKTENWIATVAYLHRHKHFKVQIKLRQKAHTHTHLTPSKVPP